MVTPSPESRAGAPDPEPRQLAVYRTYSQLQSIAKQQYSGALAGRLVLGIGFGQTGAERALATTISGGAFLGIDPDPQCLKTAVRNGSCDFMVNTLDEALRVLKNELRKRTPLSAGLLGEAAEFLTKVVERGVQPDLIAVTCDLQSHEALDELVARGAELLDTSNTAAESAGEELIWTASNLQDLRHMDKIALELLPPADHSRRQWLERAPGSFYRQKPLKRVLGLTPEEQTKLLDAFRRENLEPAAIAGVPDLL